MQDLKPFFVGCFFSLISLSLSAQTWSLSGTVEGIADGTWIFLRQNSPEVVLDSTQVAQGRFTLKGKLAEQAVHVLLYTEKFSDYVMFWLEAAPMQVTLKRGAFRQAKFSGSATQLDNERLGESVNALLLRADSLANLLSITTDKQERDYLRAQMVAAEEQENTCYIDFIKAHPNSPVAVNILNGYSTSWGREKTQELYEVLSPEMQASAEGRSIYNYISLVQDIKVGGKYVDFEQTDTDGKMTRFSSIKAKYILLEFWGSWCHPCRIENPNLVKTYRKYQPEGFEIVGIAADENRARWLQAVKDDKLPWVNLCDMKGDKNEVVLMYGVDSFPTNFLIDENGVIVAKNLRGKELQEKLEELFH